MSGISTSAGDASFAGTAPSHPGFRCSGTLIAPSVVLTAGHCTEGPATNIFVSFDDALQPDPLASGISAAERAAHEAHYITLVGYRVEIGAKKAHQRVDTAYSRAFLDSFLGS